MTHNGIWVYGYHSVTTLLQNSHREILNIVVLQKNYNTIKALLLTCYQNNLPLLKVVNPDYFNNILPSEAIHQGYAVQVKPLLRKSLNEFLQHLQIKEKQKYTLLILDQVTDSRNIGAIIRTAVAFEVKAIIMLKDHSPQENSLMNKAATGGIEHIDIIEVNNLQHAIKNLKENNFWIVGLDSHANSDLSQMNELNQVALILGSEGKGMRELTKKCCDFLVRIAINSAKMESLNISNAAAIALYALYITK